VRTFPKVQVNCDIIYLLLNKITPHILKNKLEKKKEVLEVNIFRLFHLNVNFLFEYESAGIESLNFKALNPITIATSGFWIMGIF